MSAAPHHAAVWCRQAVAPLATLLRVCAARPGQACAAAVAALARAGAARPAWDGAGVAWAVASGARAALPCALAAASAAACLVAAAACGRSVVRRRGGALPWAAALLAALASAPAPHASLPPPARALAAAALALVAAASARAVEGDAARRMRAPWPPRARCSPVAEGLLAAAVAAGAAPPAAAWAVVMRLASVDFGPATPTAAAAAAAAARRALAAAAFAAHAPAGLVWAASASRWIGHSGETLPARSHPIDAACAAIALVAATARRRVGAPCAMCWWALAGSLCVSGGAVAVSPVASVCFLATVTF